MNSSDVSGANNLRVITGPTSAGKSRLALELAARYGASIVSADSRQIYRAFDIGTGKATPDERARVPHYGIDVADPSERWSAVRFAGEAGDWIREAELASRVPVIVGGTGFWTGALIAPLAPVPDLDPKRRAALDTEMSALSHEQLHAWCRSLDPDVARRGPAQWRRAIEVALLTGRPLSEWHREVASSEPRPVRYLVVDPGAALDGRIEARIDEMIASGWVDEVRALAQRVPHDAIAWKACGYERLRAAVADATPVSEAVREAVSEAVRDVVRETRQYARRQRTWFRRQLKHGPVSRLDPLAPDAIARACAWWEGEDFE